MVKMLNKYLKGDPIPWLTDGYEPAITYAVKKEFIKDSDSKKIYKDLINSQLTNYFLKNSTNGIIGDTKRLDLCYIGSVWFFLLAAESGYSCSESFIKSTAEYLCSEIQIDNGGFKFSKGSQMPVACRTGEMVYALQKTGFENKYIDRGLNWIISNQRMDGGWLHCPVAGLGNVLKLVLFNKSDINTSSGINQNQSSCPVASYTCLRALIKSNSESYKDAIEKGFEYFIRNNFFSEIKGKILCGNSVRFDMLGYPIMTQYDYLSGMLLAVKYGKNISSSIFNSIIKKQNPDGSWNNENSANGMIDEKKGRSRWVTLNALRIMDEVIKRENQFENA